MISQKTRVPREKISFILNKGESTTSRLFIIRYALNNINFSRYRTIVSKKIHSKAINRNKLRRQIYEAIRSKEKMSKDNTAKYNIIMIPKKSILSASFTEISNDINSFLSRL